MAFDIKIIVAKEVFIVIQKICASCIIMLTKVLLTFYCCMTVYCSLLASSSPHPRPSLRCLDCKQWAK